MKLSTKLIYAGMATVFGGCAITFGVLSYQSGKSDNNKPWYIAHRGAPGGDGKTYHFENITESFEDAARAVDSSGKKLFMGLETDVYMTRPSTVLGQTERWVVCHDDRCFANPNDPSQRYYDINEEHADFSQKDDNIVNIEFSEAMSRNIVPSKSYPAYINDSHHHICSFNDYLGTCKEYNMMAIIEIKEPSQSTTANDVRDEYGYLCMNGYKSETNNYLDDLWRDIVDAGMADQCYIISFQEAYVRWFKECEYTYEGKTNTNIYKNHRLQQLCSYAKDDPDNQDLSNNTGYKTLIDKGYDISVGDDETAWINTNMPPITEEMVQYAHQHNCLFGAWTVNIKAEDSKMRKFGVDFITTDYYRPIHSFDNEPKAFDGEGS